VTITPEQENSTTAPDEDEVIESPDEDQPLQLLGHMSTPVGTSRVSERNVGFDKKVQSAVVSNSSSRAAAAGKKNDTYRPSSERNVALGGQRQSEPAALSTLSRGAFTANGKAAMATGDLRHYSCGHPDHNEYHSIEDAEHRSCPVCEHADTVLRQREDEAARLKVALVSVFLRCLDTPMVTKGLCMFCDVDQATAAAVRQTAEADAVVARREAAADAAAARRAAEADAQKARKQAMADAAKAMRKAEADAAEARSKADAEAKQTREHAEVPPSHVFRNPLPPRLEHRYNLLFCAFSPGDGDKVDNRSGRGKTIRGTASSAID
jgi:hypothetical protein